LLVAPLLFFATCDADPDDADPGNPNTGPIVPEKDCDDFDTWNEWLEYKYGKEFGWDADNSRTDVKVPITHNMLAEEYFFAKGINAGWNLGGTYELGINPRALSANSHYDKLMAGLKAAGINLVRIPVTWSSGDHGGGGGASTSGGNTIPSTWLNNIEAAVTAAHNAGLAVLINTHHEKNFFRLDLAGQSYQADGASGTDYKTYTTRFTNIWSQIAERFKDYGDWLMFEALNEPTINDAYGGTIWDGAPKAYNEVLAKWNQAFVDLVRDTGGNNAKRYLVFKSYGAKLLTGITPGNGFSIPIDPAGAGRLVFSFHYYIPAGLALTGETIDWSKGNEIVYEGQYANAQEAFIKKGIPVISGETGSTFQSARIGKESVQANKNRLLLLNAIGYCGREYGVIPCLWDCGRSVGVYPETPNGETLGMFRRNSLVETDYTKWGLPIDHARLAAVGNGNQAWNVTGNAAYEDSDYGTKAVQAYIDAINGRTKLGKPVYSEKLKELMDANSISY
jgi:endoglucanase